MEPESAEWSERLETVRERTGLSSKDFWRKVMGEASDGTYQWSGDPEGKEPRYAYRTVVRYHRTDEEHRKPPVDYLKRVAEVFDIPIQWLITGTGPSTKVGAEMRWISHPLRRQLKEESDWFASHSMSIQWAFLDLLHLYQMQPGPRQVVDRGGHEVDVKHAKDLEFLLRLPLVAWGYDPANHSEVPRSYWRYVSGALQDAIWSLYRADTPGADPVPRNEPFVRYFRDTYYGQED